MSAICTEFDVDYKKHRQPHRRNDSGEIDVFDAMRYFLGEERCCHASSLKNFTVLHKPNVREGCQYGEVNKSLDDSLIFQQSAQKQQKRASGNKLPKTPNSPGIKLASLLNSLFTSTVSKKKQKPTSLSAKDCNESPIEIRKRRSSMTNLRSVSDNSPKSLYSSSSCIDTSSSLSSNGKIYKEFDDVIDTKNDFQLKYFPTNRRSLTLFPASGVLDDKSCINVAWLEQNFIVTDVFSALNNAGNNANEREKERERDSHRETTKERRKERNDASVERERNERDECRQEKSPWKTEEVDDGFESDSSSDLFELENYDLRSHYQNELPVYGITHLQNKN